jgi:hypothetical protein
MTKFGAHCTSHLTSISHLTSKPTHDASRHPALWWRWEDVRALYRAQEAWLHCHLKAYAGGGYDVAFRCIRTVCYPSPIEKLIQIPLEKGSRHAIPRPFQPKLRCLTLDCHVIHNCDRADCSILTARSKNEGDPTTPPHNEYYRFSLLNTEPLHLPPAVRAHTPPYTD